MVESVFGNCALGSTGHWPVPSGDSPDGTGRASPANPGGQLRAAALLVPVGGSPTGTGGSPVPPIFQTRSEPPGRVFPGRADGVRTFAIGPRSARRDASGHFGGGPRWFVDAEPGGIHLPSDRASANPLGRGGAAHGVAK